MPVLFFAVIFAVIFAVALLLFWFGFLGWFSSLVGCLDDGSLASGISGYCLGGVLFKLCVFIRTYSFVVVGVGGSFRRRIGTVFD